MYPFIHLFSLEIPLYPILIFIGFIIGVILVILRAKIYNIKKLPVILSSIFVAIGLLFGAKLLFALTQVPTLIEHWELVTEHPAETLAYIFGGFVFYGGLFGALAALKLFSFQFDQPFLILTNLYAPVIPLIHAIGRVGCFFTGCCYGIEYHGPFSLNYPDNAIIEGVNLVSRFPVQLLESFLNFLLFIGLFIYARKPRKEGSILGIYFICYALIRFGVEFLRGDTVRGIFFGISTSQWISLLLIPLGIYLIKARRSQ